MLKKISPSLVEEAKKDKKVLANIVDILWQPVFRFLFKKTLDLEKAKQLTQKTFIDIAASIKGLKIKDDYSFAILAYQTAIENSNEKKGIFRKTEEAKELRFGTEDVSYVKNEFDEAYKTMVNSPGIKEAKRVMNIIDPKYKDAVILHYLEQESIEDTAKILNKTPASIKAMLSKSINKIENVV